jgi:hypothetical protein
MARAGPAVGSRRSLTISVNPDVDAVSVTQHTDEPPHGGTMEPNHSQSNPQPDSKSAAPRLKAKLLDLARYRYGQRVFWIVFRSQRDPNCEVPDEQMIEEHPWMRWRYKMMPWNVPMKPPRTHPADTMAIMMLCLQRPKIEPFRIKDIARSANIGCFVYTGSNGLVMPEGLLFPTKRAARREITRIAKMFAAWTGTWEEGVVDEPPKQE